MLTRPEIAEKTGVPECTLKRMLPELKEYDILSSPVVNRVDGMMVYTVEGPENIETLRADMNADRSGADD